MKVWSLLCIVASSTVLLHQVNGESNKTVLYYGFMFNNETVATSLKSISDSYFNQTLQKYPEFAAFLQNVTNSAGLNKTSPYYAKPLDPNTKEFDPFYHVTAKFCGPDQTGCAAYAEEISEHLNTNFEMELVGFVLTNRTFGIRVNLSPAQAPIFKEGTPFSVGEEEEVEADEEPAAESSKFPGLTLEAQDPPSTLPVVHTRAHITLGCAPGIPAVTTGRDMFDTINFEIRESRNDSVVVTTKEIPDPLDESKQMIVKLYESGDQGNSSDPQNYLFVVYPRMKIKANATLLPYNQETSSSVRVFSCEFLVLLTTLLSFALSFRRIE